MNLLYNRNRYISSVLGILIANRLDHFRKMWYDIYIEKKKNLLDF